MSVYRDLVENFFIRYEEPIVEELVVGFSGIDPPLKGGAAELNHEELSGLLGGNVLEKKNRASYCKSLLYDL